MKKLMPIHSKNPDGGFEMKKLMANHSKHSDGGIKMRRLLIHARSFPTAAAR